MGRNRGGSGGVASVGDVGVEREEVVSSVRPGVAGQERSENAREDAAEMGRRAYGEAGVGEVFEVVRA